MITRRLILPLALSLAAACAIEPEPEPEPIAVVQPTASTPRALDPDAPTILEPNILARYKAALPRVAYKRLQEIFDSPSTLWWDKETMIPSYQDSVGDGSYTPIGARANSQGRAVIVPEGKRLFSDDGETWSFPFAETAGTDKATNTHIINFLSLPIENGAFLPIVYDTVDNQSALGGLGLHQWSWMFPRRTVIGEVIFLRNAANDLIPAEVRIRVRYLEGWATNAYRPFPTAFSLSAAIKRVRPNWNSQPNLQAFIAHLEDPNTLTDASMSSPDFNNVFSTSGSLDILPNLNDPALVTELLTTTVFTSAYGSVWKANPTQQTFAASTRETFSFVPDNYEAGLLEVREASCMRCHDDAGRSINDFEPAAILYGDIWGMDKIFSFHPWDHTQYVNFNHENRVVRPELTSIVVRYNPSTHTADNYRDLP